MNANDPTEDKKRRGAHAVLRVFAVLVAVEALLQGIQLIAAGGGSALLGFFVMALLLVLAWGLWQLKNWARIGLVVVIVITFILQLIGAGLSFADNAGLNLRCNFRWVYPACRNRVLAVDLEIEYRFFGHSEPVTASYIIAY